MLGPNCLVKDDDALVLFENSRAAVTEFLVEPHYKSGSYNLIAKHYSELDNVGRCN